MCGRYVLNASGTEIAQALGISQAPEVTSSFNIPPGTRQWVAHAAGEGGVVLEQLGWGYRPVWAGQDAPQPINARAEKVAASPFFRDAFARYRCVVPATGWYEWQKHDGAKTPYYVTTAQPLMFFAGLYDPPREDSAGSFAIITQPAAQGIAHIHPRMPVVLDQTCLQDWLDPANQTRDEVKAVTRALDPAQLNAWRVDTRVNKPANDDAGLIASQG
ncbi:SOS response-associated peptidase [Spiribacter insolitus]|uniref:Abasic site processing protein n=1 Tax=Spiribacter insolitus TaxID=3122417 RepID=A0ABV3T911_9GAMM